MAKATTAASNRWVILGAASTVMLLIGTIYSWAIFTEPLAALFHQDVTTITLTYSIANFSLAVIGTVIGGFWQDRVGPQVVAIAGISLWGLGNLLAGLGTPALGVVWLYVTYGLIGGVGAGMAYVTPLAVVSKWFPDKRGLASGFVAGGFGLGAFLYSQLVPRLSRFREISLQASAILSAHRADPTAAHATTAWQLAAALTNDGGVLAQVFVASGLLFLVLGVPVAALCRNPPSTFRTCDARDPQHGACFTPAQVIGLPQFYLLWTQLFANVICGITVISNAVSITAELTHLSSASIAPLCGLMSIFNAIGRLFWGAVSDRIGCNSTFAVMFAVQATTLAVLAHAHGLATALGGISILLLCCGGGFGTMPSYNARFFGTQHMGLNYGLLLTAWGFAGLVGPLFAARTKDLTGSFATLLPPVTAMLAVAIVVPLVTRAPLAARLPGRPGS